MTTRTNIVCINFGLLLLYILPTKVNSDLLSPSILNDKLDPAIYDKMLPPQKVLFNKSTAVLMDIYVESISSLKESSMDYIIDFYLHLEWYDQRLSHNGTTFLETNNLEIEKKMWWPDLYIANAKEASFSSVTVPNLNIRVHPGGKVWISRRIRGTLACNMKLEKFPSDKQLCGFKMVTYMSLTDTVHVRWLSENASILMDEDVELPDFDIGEKYSYHCPGSYEQGMYSCLIAKFELKRFSGYHLLQTFIPSSVVVMISWIGFWITPRAVPARVTLSITTFLALSTQLQGVKMALPAISYATAIDYWTTICTVFVFGALLEFAFAYHLWEKESARIIGEKKQQLKGPKNDENGVMWATTRPNSTQAVGAKPVEPKNEDLNSHDKKVLTKALSAWQLKTVNSSKVDRFSRFLFPISFLICNIIFWSTYPPNFNMKHS